MCVNKKAEREELLLKTHNLSPQNERMSIKHTKKKSSVQRGTKKKKVEDSGGVEMLFSECKRLRSGGS